MVEISNTNPLFCIETLALRRQSQVLVFAAVNLDLDLLAPLYECLNPLPNNQPLDVVFYSRGGMVNAARRIALLLRERFSSIRFLIPHYCESAGTLTVLSADEIVAGPLAVFSPIDPLLSSDNGDNGPSALSVQDLRLFSAMTQDWFGLEAEQARQHALATLCENFFPATLTAFHRCTQEAQDIAKQLLAFPFPDDGKRREAITQQLLFGYHSHHYAVTAAELKALGLPIATAGEDLLEPLWALGRQFHARLGGSAQHADGSRLDTLILNAAGGWMRQSNGPAVHWLPWDATLWDAPLSIARQEQPSHSHSTAGHEPTQSLRVPRSAP